MSRYPFLSTVEAGGWVLARERWPCPPPRGRSSWLLGRVAAEEAVRHRAEGGRVAIVDDGPGRVAVRVPGVAGPAPVALSIGHSGLVGVALAGAPGSGPGIDVAEVLPWPATSVAAVLDARELALVERLPGNPAGWFIRFCTAKVAVAKARGGALDGRPQDLPVVRVAHDRAKVQDPDGRVHRVRLTTVDVRDRHYVVARTGG